MSEETEKKEPDEREPDENELDEKEPDEEIQRSDDDADVIFDTLWDRVLVAWDEDKTHHALMEHAVRSQQLPILAGRYKKLSDDPEKGVRAKKKLEGVVIAATQMLLATKTPDLPERPKWLTVVVGIVCIAVIIWLLYKVVFSHPT